MAKKKSKGLMPGGRARSLVTITRHSLANAVAYKLPVNPDFALEETTRPPEGGVEYPSAPEWREAEQAIAEAFNNEMGDIHGWLRWAAKVAGGLPMLAAKLAGLSAPDYKSAAFKREHRALQRLMPGAKKEKHANVRPDRRARFLDLNARLLRAGKINLKVRGDWEIRSGAGGNPQVRVYHNWTIEGQTPENIAVLDAGGRGFCAWAETNYADVAMSFVKLERVYELQIEYLEEE